jgi:hypothetical protein
MSTETSVGPAGDRVGGAGQVIGVDVNSAMIDVAGAVAAGGSGGSGRSGGLVTAGHRGL